MARAGGLSGFPPGETIHRSNDEEWMERIYEITRNLVEGQSDTVPDVTYQRHELHVSAPGDNEEEKSVAVRWPMSSEQYGSFWHPQVEEPSAQKPDTEEVAKASPLDIFLPKLKATEKDYELNSQAIIELRKKLERAKLAARLSVITMLLDSIPEDPFIRAYIDSHGVFDRKQGQYPPMGFNFDGIDRNIFYRRGDGLHPIFDSVKTSRESSGSIDTIQGLHASLLDGQMYKSEIDRESWEASIRVGVNSLVEELKVVPQYYLDQYDEKGHLTSQQEYGTARQIGTSATREFFEGYYQFAPAGITLLKAVRRKNLFGAVDYKDSQEVGSISTVYIALKHGLAGRPHLVRLQAIESGDPDEPQAEVRAYGYPFHLDGEMMNHRIGGYYGDLSYDHEGTVERMGDKMRSQIDPSTLERIRRGEPVGTETTHFSHNDFFDIVEYLSSLAMAGIE